jgi:hypothetical protein
MVESFIRNLLVTVSEASEVPGPKVLTFLATTSLERTIRYGDVHQRGRPVWWITRGSANMNGARAVQHGRDMRLLGRHSWFAAAALVASAAAGLAGPVARVLADEPDPRAEMTRALEAQADVAPAAATMPAQALPERAQLPAPAKGASAVARSAALRAAIHAAVAEVARALPSSAAPAARAAAEPARGGRLPTPPGKRH